MAIGCLGIAGQLVLLRELLAAYGGNEFSAGVTLAAWLLCEALGAWLAGHTGSSLAAAAPVGQCIVHRPAFLAALSILFSLAAVFAAILVRPLLGVLPGETLSIPYLLLATFSVVLLPAAAHGALFVSAAALRTQGVGSAYVWEGLGTTLAGLACFLLLNRLPSTSAMALFSLVLIAALAIEPEPGRTKWTLWTLGPAALASLALLVFGLPAERFAWGRAWRGQRVAAVANSPYGKIVRLERAGQQLIVYDGLPVLTLPPTQIERTEELSLLPVLCHPAPRRVLVLGYDLAIPTALVRFRPDIEVTTVQLDPILARLSLAAMSADSSLPAPPFSLLTTDPVAFLRTAGDTFDCVILTDAAPSNLGSSRLFTVEFYRLCRSRLAPGGILAGAGPGSPTGLSPDAADILSTRLRSLKATFEHVLLVAADFPLLLASDRPLNTSTESLLLRLARLSEPPRLLDSSYVASLLDPLRQQALASALKLGDRNPDTRVTSAALPRELFLSMVRDNRLVSPAFGSLYARLADLSPRLLLLLGAALMLAGLVGAVLGGHSFSRGFAILTSGFSGAAVSSLLLFAWQARFGSVFSGVSLLVAAFMLGTVLGGIAGTSAGHSRPSPRLRRGTFAAADIVLAASAAATMALIRGGPAGAFLLANLGAGACLGFQFALATSTATGDHGPRSPRSDCAPAAIRRSAGVVTALDLAGGSLGGILTALILVPVFGLGAAALSAGGVKLASALVQLAGTRPRSQT